MSRLPSDLDSYDLYPHYGLMYYGDSERYDDDDGAADGPIYELVVNVNVHLKFYTTYLDGTRIMDCRRSSGPTSAYSSQFSLAELNTWDPDMDELIPYPGIPDKEVVENRLEYQTINQLKALEIYEHIQHKLEYRRCPGLYSTLSDTMELAKGKAQPTKGLSKLRVEVTVIWNLRMERSLPIGKLDPMIEKLISLWNEGEDGEDVQCCAICLVDYEDGARVANLACSHKFHGDCIKKWLHRSRPPTCPMCRCKI